MTKFCKVCHRQDEYVLDDGLCILHCSKSTWKCDGKWNIKAVNKFWSVIRDEIMTKDEKHNFTFMVFPPMQISKTLKCSADNTHTLHTAKNDHSFWRIGGEISFNHDVDFSFSHFEEALNFHHVQFKNLKLNNVKANKIRLNQCSADIININKTRSKQLLLQQCSIKTVNLDSSAIEELNCKSSKIALIDFNLAQFNTLLFENNHIAQLKAYKIKAQNIQFESGITRRIHLLDSYSKNLLINEMKTQSFKFENSSAEYLSFQNTQINEYHISKSKIENGINMSKLIVNNLTFTHNSFGLTFTLKLRKLSANMFSLLHNSRINLLQIENSLLKEKFIIKHTQLNNLVLKTLNLASAHLSLEKCTITHPNFNDVKFNTLNNKTFSYDLNSLEFMYELFKEMEEKKSQHEITILKESLNTYLKKENQIQAVVETQISALELEEEKESKLLNIVYNVQDIITFFKYKIMQVTSSFSIRKIAL